MFQDKVKLEILGPRREGIPAICHTPKTTASEGCTPSDPLWVNKDSLPVRIPDRGPQRRSWSEDN